MSLVMIPVQIELLERPVLSWEDIQTMQPRIGLLSAAVSTTQPVDNGHQSLAAETIPPVVLQLLCQVEVVPLRVGETQPVEITLPSAGDTIEVFQVRMTGGREIISKIFEPGSAHD